MAQRRRSAGDGRDLSGRTFGLLHVVEEADNVKHRNTFWTCQCDCGNQVYVSGTNLRLGYTTSCGCNTDDDRRQ
jgi:membrane protein implicated in regulation of membrane protease activity